MFRVAVSVFLALFVCEFITMTTADELTCFLNDTIDYMNPLPLLHTNYRTVHGSTNVTFLKQEDSYADIYFDYGGTTCARTMRAFPGPVQYDGIKTTAACIGKRLVIQDVVLRGGSAGMNGCLGLMLTMSLLFLEMKA